VPLCAGCRGDLPANAPACPRCAAPVPAAVPACARCLRRPPPFDSVFAPFRYAWPLDAALLGWKAGGDPELGRLLEGLFAEAVAALLAAGALPRPEALVPVPLHGRRLRERGFDQAGRLARAAARAAGLPVAWGLVRRVRATPVQSGLGPAARRRNVRGAFALARAGPLPWRSVALVDDVLTTGATATELVRLLRRAGAREVAVWTLLRTAPAVPRRGTVPRGPVASP